MDKTTGVYICTGCGIGDALELDPLKELVSDEYGISICKDHPFLCGKEGVELIKGDVEGEGVNTIVIAACSGRVNYDVFDFGPDKIVERVNLREQVAWCQPPNEEDTQMLAEDYLRMGCAKANDTEPPVPFQAEEEYSKDILVVGGGIAGMTAALDTAKAGYRAVLVEKEAGLGGFLAKMKKRITMPYKELTDTGADALIQAVEEHPNIQVYTSSTVEKISGGPGLFSVEIKTENGSASERVGAVIQATGWVPYDASKLEHLGYGKFKNVLTNVEMEQMAAAGKIKRPSDGKDAKSVLFVQCAGSRDPEHLPYCSSVCCLVSLKQATYLKEQDPEAVSYILYKDMRTLGQAEDFYRKAQNDGNIFIRGSVMQVGESGDKLFVEAEDELLGEKVRLEELDLVVLATGLVPASKPEVTPMIKAPADAEDADEDGMIEVLPDSGFFANSALNLEYRQGPELPTLKYGFPDSHFICFPYETRRTGIYSAGCIRRPMETAKALDDAAGAAMKAIQCAEATAKGIAVHPRAGDMSFPEFNMQRCTQCKRCTEECPFGAINEDEKANPLPNPTRCRRCGVCMGACPERIISFKNYSVGMIGNMLKAIHVPEEDEEKPRIVAFVCENDAYPALDMAGIKRMNWSPYVRFIPVRCLGSINLVWVADSLSRGIDGLLFMGCRHGDDYQCHFIKGSELANTRLSKVSETLDRLALESERVKFVEVGITDYYKIPEIISEFMETIDEVGPNPYKGW
ncbi:MAG: hydrogenase iron-sulfur subunit [Deltaproteobacteria bacterium]|nr:hydrogenase iron-sulfur subunit [Deltaproteobacteria bacterium]MBW1925247.1 hydrogenase iron-sulfur subunit [Deltaproteobacteria bacterium]MBW1950639.1 hydrogenase iron-sulfur subunit [Deltaproteobacteria bacterium]MBW2008554.1 hydrogenase iron-sulfur subunit [Deltaproteobacteria bacterium]MBW2102354.1 hydrogenase iron-sulfur subunit [Deltaproteobacteria bacterium]